jgi:hypothetical protein
MKTTVVGDKLKSDRAEENIAERREEPPRAVSATLIGAYATFGA